MNSNDNNNNNKKKKKKKKKKNKTLTTHWSPRTWIGSSTNGEHEGRIKSNQR